MTDKPRKRRSKVGSKPAELAAPQTSPPTASIVHDSPCSVELSRDAKGQPRWAIKLYGEMDELDSVIDEVLRVDARLREETK